MSLAINTIVPVSAASGAATPPLLQPGTTVNARVVSVGDGNNVRIAIGDTAIDVQSQVPLSAGQSLRLQVSQTSEGLRLQIQPQGAGTNNAATALALSAEASASLVLENALVDAPPIAPLKLSAQQAVAISAASQAAAAKQSGLAPLFADVSEAALLPNLPAPLQQAAAQLLATRPQLNAGLTGNDVEAAFKASGLFLEQTLATGSAPSASGQSAPDLKAALIVFRQTVDTWLGAQSNGQGITSSAATIAPNALGATTTIVSGNPGGVTPETLALAFRAATANGNFTSLQEVLQSFPKGVRDAVANLLAQSGTTASLSKTLAANTLAAAFANIATNSAAAPQDIPPPPLRGALPSAQPVSIASISGDATPLDAAHQLRDGADAALARQTLLQVASLPQNADPQTPRNDINSPRWNFEIPFATPQGTAVAQFEISRDGGGIEVNSLQRIWRARFSLNVEPSGPVHALVSLSGERTSVRIWAERPTTAAQLRAAAPQLDHALREAALEPGDIVIGDGAPPQPVKSAAGHFLDRAS